MASSGANFTSSSIAALNSAAIRATLDWQKETSMPILRDFLRQQPGNLFDVDVQGNTIVHFLAMSGRASALKELFQDRLLTSQQLMQLNHRRDTALHGAARLGQRNVAEIMMKKNPNLAFVRNNLGETPLYVAAAYGKMDVFNILRRHGGDLIRRNDGRTILHAAVNGEHYSLALELLELYPDLAAAHDEKGTTALNLLATKPKSFKSGSAYSLKNLGNRAFVPLQFILCMAYLCIPSVAQRPKAPGDLENQRRQNGVLINQLKSLFATKLISGWIIRGYHRIIRAIYCLRGVDDIKQHHAFAILLAKKLITLQEGWSHYTYGDCSPELRKYQAPTEDQLHICHEGSMIFDVAILKCCNTRMMNRMQNPLIQAVNCSIQEMVEEILGKFPDAAFFIDKNGQNILHVAVECKDRKMYDYLKSKVPKDEMLAAMDNRGNSILHLATRGGSSPNIIHGHMDQMAWDICWFKRIWYDTPPHFFYHRNADGKTASEIFEENHSRLREKAEKTLKERTSALLVVATVIGTCNYAAFFTIPGGFVEDPHSENFGRPSLFSNREGYGDLKLFLWFTGSALYSYALCLASMSLILVSRFRSSDFYMSLPFNFLASQITLFLSAVATLLAWDKALGLVEKENKPDPLMLPFLSVATLLVIGLLYPTAKYMIYALRCAFSFMGKENVSSSLL